MLLCYLLLSWIFQPNVMIKATSPDIWAPWWSSKRKATLNNVNAHQPLFQWNRKSSHLAVLWKHRVILDLCNFLLEPQSWEILLKALEVCAAFSKHSNFRRFGRMFNYQKEIMLLIKFGIAIITNKWL